jgi:hypothetical protein
MTQHRYVRFIFASFFLSLLLGGGNRILAADYYVSWQSGNDTNSGISPEAPWKSLARVNHADLQPGDRVLLHVGETWREELRPPVSGAQDQPIVFTSYGNGPRPILDGNGDGSGDHNGPISRTSSKKTPTRDVAIDNNERSHIVYDGLELRHVLEGLRVYAWSASVRDITMQNCLVQTEVAPVPPRQASAGVYANVRTGTISELHVLGNHFIPYPRGLNHWGVYLVGGVQHFRIDENTFGPSGEDAITIWHSAYGEIALNQGGGNGENTIDVKDSHDIVIRNNDADLDREYNIVVHSVDAPDSTYNVHVEGNRCLRGGQGGELSAGIALLFVQKSGVEDNVVNSAYGSGILIKDAGAHSENWASRNRLTANGVGQKLQAIVLQGASTARIDDNQIVPPPIPAR